MHHIKFLRQFLHLSYSRSCFQILVSLLLEAYNVQIHCLIHSYLCHRQCTPYFSTDTHIGYNPLQIVAYNFQDYVFFYQRVLEPTEAQCSNQYLASLADPTRKVITPSQLYSQQRMQLFGHLHTHPESIENKSTYMSSHAYRHVRAGRNPA